MYPNISGNQEGAASQSAATEALLTVIISCAPPDKQTYYRPSHYTRNSSHLEKHRFMILASTQWSFITFTKLLIPSFHLVWDILCKMSNCIAAYSHTFMSHSKSCRLHVYKGLTTILLQTTVVVRSLRFHCRLNKVRIPCASSKEIQYLLYQ